MLRTYRSGSWPTRVAATRSTLLNRTFGSSFSALRLVPQRLDFLWSYIVHRESEQVMVLLVERDILEIVIHQPCHVFDAAMHVRISLVNVAARHPEGPVEILHLYISLAYTPKDIRFTTKLGPRPYGSWLAGNRVRPPGRNVNRLDGPMAARSRVGLAVDARCTTSRAPAGDAGDAHRGQGAADDGFCGGDEAMHAPDLEALADFQTDGADDYRQKTNKDAP